MTNSVGMFMVDSSGQGEEWMQFWLVYLQDASALMLGLDSRGLMAVCTSGDGISHCRLIQVPSGSLASAPEAPGVSWDSSATVLSFISPKL